MLLFSSFDLLTFSFFWPSYCFHCKLGARPEHSTSLGDGDKHQRDEALWTKLQAKVTKLNNLEEEVRRIMSKEGGTVGLSDGQRRQSV